MEANLNQFRLLTVRGEQEANSRRGSCGCRSRHPPDCPRGVTSDGTTSLSAGESESNGSMNGTMCVSGHDKRVTGNCVPPVRNSPVQRHPNGLEPPTQTSSSDNDDVEVSDEDGVKNEDCQITSDGENSLVNALRSLEMTLNDHTLQLTKRLRRELTVKGSNNEPVAQTSVGASPLPAKTAHRGDKV